MEKAIIFVGLLLAMACANPEASKTEKKEIPEEKSVSSNTPQVFCEVIPSEGKGTFIPPKTVQWMYLDDSLKNICRALNFRLPYMGSDIRSIPEMITPEVLSLSPIRSFEILSKEKVVLSDSISFFLYQLEKGNCHCDIVRIYKGNSTNPGFDGFEITEQIICNAQDELVGSHQPVKTNSSANGDQDTSHTYEVHGHEH